VVLVLRRQPPGPGHHADGRLRLDRHRVVRDLGQRVRVHVPLVRLRFVRLRRHRDERLVSGSWLWYVRRGTGLVALGLLSLTLLGGILVRGGVAPARTPRFVMWGLHRNVALLSLVFLAVHITSVVADSYVPINLADAFVPFVSAYRPVWLGLGTVALDLLLAI